MNSNELKALLATLQATQDGTVAVATETSANEKKCKHIAALEKANDVDSILDVLKGIQSPNDAFEYGELEQESLPSPAYETLATADNEEMPSYEPLSGRKERSQLTFAESLPILTSLCADEEFVEV